MSELINNFDDRTTIRWKLLTGVSALALSGYVSTTSMAKAEDNRPVLWIDVSGQFQQLTDPSETWVPGNLPPVIDHPVAGVLGQMPRIGYDMGGKLTFEPNGSDWDFSVAIQYGKAKRGPKFAHDQTYKTHKSHAGIKYVPTTYAFTDLHAVQEVKHVVLDFQAGKDVGLGLFGGHGSATLEFGVRIAQLVERSDGIQTAQTAAPGKYSHGHQLNAYMHGDRSFWGIGPSVAWSGSVPIAGSLHDGLALDWGADAALLFGRQKANVNTHTEEITFAGTEYVNTGFATVPQPIFNQKTHSTLSSMRRRIAVVPNLGGMIGVSFRNGDAKVSFGYKADFFFNAVDAGIATRNTKDRGFYGPFATVSVGLGK